MTLALGPGLSRLSTEHLRKVEIGSISPAPPPFESRRRDPAAERLAFRSAVSGSRQQVNGPGRGAGGGAYAIKGRGRTKGGHSQPAWPALPGTQRCGRLVPDRPRDQVGREWRCWPAARFRATEVGGKEAGQGGVNVESPHPPVARCSSLGSGASPQLCWERDKQVLAFLPWGRSCLRSHLSAPTVAEAGLAQELSV